MIQSGIECLILGCTHYPFLKREIKKITGNTVSLLSQDEIIPEKLQDYLDRHPEYNDHIEKNGHTEFFVSDVTDGYIKAAKMIYGHDIEIQKAIY